MSKHHETNREMSYGLLLEPSTCRIERQQPFNLASLHLNQLLCQTADTLLQLELQGLVQALPTVVHVLDGAACTVYVLVCRRQVVTSLLIQKNSHASSDETEVFVTGPASRCCNCPIAMSLWSLLHQHDYDFNALGVPKTLIDMRFPASAAPARVLDAEAESESRSRRGTLWRGDADPSRSPPATAGSALNALDVVGKLSSVKTSVIEDDVGSATPMVVGKSGLESGSLSARFRTHVRAIDSGPGRREMSSHSTRYKRSSTVQYCPTVVHTNTCGTAMYEGVLEGHLNYKKPPLLPDPNLSPKPFASLMNLLRVLSSISLPPSAISRL